MPAPSDKRPTLALDPLHSPGSDTQELHSPAVPSALTALTLSAQHAGPTADLMAKTKRRMFSSPMLRRSATASSAAAASAASKIKSNLSTVKLPTALKRNSANSRSAAAAPSVPVGCVPSLSRSSTESSVKKAETNAMPNNGKKFGIPSLKHIRAAAKDKVHSKRDCPLDSPEAKSQRSNNSSEEETSNEDSVTPQHATSAMNTASRFVMGMPTMLRRAVSNNHPPGTDAPALKKSPDTSANSTPRGESSGDDWDENDRHSLLMMLQVPEARNSLIPLMAVSQAW
ncbi:hypothetical protein L916_01117 [Phytophthora nicotianae]|uniref:Uncharacterized protein n=1 Tax=Phytophthora nicotianae TaxID=4792 RepID=W2JSQ7_PHYNI|nr:hypothetical protein L916_01117 [Phytophthora nicotianae]